MPLYCKQPASREYYRLDGTTALVVRVMKTFTEIRVVKDLSKENIEVIKKFPTVKKLEFEVMLMAAFQRLNAEIKK